MRRTFLFFPVLIIAGACSHRPDDEPKQDKQTLFQQLPAQETGLHFQNTLTILEDLDVFRYRNYYNGGGVAIADIDNDGLADIFFTSNMSDNKLFLNKGNWQFEDITEKAGVKGTKVWSTGVSIADVNADGWLDIYVCNSGDINGDDRENELFINNRDGTFSEQAAAYGLADKGFSTHAVFFDYDKDGDLDCYVLNNSFRPISTLGYRNLRHQRDEMGGDKLYQNQGGRFVDVSRQAGIFGSVIGFGLGVTVGDVNQDNWPDLYISNDFYERDYLYINNRDGTFSEQSDKTMGHLSMFSMGADMADLNNDGYPEIFSTDMLPEDDKRLKTMAAFESYDVYQLRLGNGYYHQLMRNMLHINNRDGTFSEAGELAGVEATDWSWAVLMADFDNDGYKDIFVTNGIYKDVTNQDFVEYLGSSEQMHAAIDGKKIDFQKFVDQMPSQKLSNYLFTRTGEWRYKNVSPAWGLDEPGFSNGAAYGDLDNDGDLDLVVNNVNQEPFVYRNRTDELKQNDFLSVTFKGPAKNPFGIGACVKVFTGGEIIARDHIPTRGFQSSMDYKMIVGLGAGRKADSVMIIWPDDRVEVIRTVAANKTLAVAHANASARVPAAGKEQTPMLREMLTAHIVHHENQYNDFDRDRLLYHMLSTQGPAYAKADVNNDGLDDIFMGGSVGETAAVYLQRPGFEFVPIPAAVFAEDSLAEDVDAVFFDADADGDLDLLVVTGGSEHLNQLPMQVDRLYENKGVINGIPVFEKTKGKLPVLYQSGSCVRPADWDNDGDLDVFIGTRVIPSYYGMPCDQFLLENDGHGNFKEVTAAIAPELKQLGMVTDAVWFNYDGDDMPDLLIVGDWMPVTVFRNNGKQLVRVDNIAGLDRSEGWWNRIKPADLDGDGDLDFVLGNLGLNAKFKPTAGSPITLYVNDFDRNGSVEPVYAFRRNGEEYPMAMRPDLIRQMSSLKKHFVYYKDYADKSIAGIFDAKQLERATRLRFCQPHTCVLWNDGPAGFRLKPLPVQAQLSPVYGIEVCDVNNDTRPDIVLGGNLYAVKPEVGRYDALHGLLLLGEGNENFRPLHTSVSGVKVEGEIRHISVVGAQGNDVLAFIRNNNTVKFYRKEK